LTCEIVIVVVVVRKKLRYFSTVQSRLSYKLLTCNISSAKNETHEKYEIG